MTRAILCGTVYGGTYVPVLTAPDAPVQLAGILSRGSARSVQMARASGVPHFTSIDQISTIQADIVIVAVASEPGVALAGAALSQGFHVLAEHPIEPDAVAELTQLAADKERVFYINGHWADHENAVAFAEGCRAAAASGPAKFANLITNPRTFYSALDLLHRVVGPVDTDSFARLDHPAPMPGAPFTILQGRAGATQVTIQMQTFTSRVDDGTSALTSHHLTVGYAHGHLTLAETCAPALWVPDGTRLYMMGPAGLSQPAAQFFPSETAPSVGDFNKDHRSAANQRVLEHLVSQAQGAPPPSEQTPEYLQNLSRAWRALMILTGPIAYVG